MIIAGFFRVVKLEDKDSSGFERVALAENEMVDGLQMRLFLPVGLRGCECDMAVGKRVYAFGDDVTGYGVALYSPDADTRYRSTADWTFDKTVTVQGNITGNSNLKVSKNIDSTTGNITAKVGDVQAAQVSLKTHTHPATLSVTGTAVAGAVTGTAQGTTSTP